MDDKNKRISLFQFYIINYIISLYTFSYYIILNFISIINVKLTRYTKLYH